ncbi:porin [Parasalinivibrio latis]|uniref:porin n=1 Tax=Parasalinivibrio latis TaxID=2952610 RepID=UPI0030E108B7
MNKSIIALAVASVAGPASVSAAEIYSDANSAISINGRVEAVAQIRDGEVDDQSRARIGFMGQSQLTPDLYGVGYYEAQLNSSTNAPIKGTSNSAENIETRYAYAGVGGDFGEVGYGRADGSLGMITDFTDIMAYDGAAASSKLVVADRVDNNLYYKGTFNDLTVKANYSFANSTVVANQVESNDNEGYSIGATYNLPIGLGLGLGYAEQSYKTLKDDTQLIAAINYTIGDFYVAGLYTTGDRLNDLADYDGYELAAAYNLNQWVFTTTYGNGTVDPKGAGPDVDVADVWALDATYFFNTKFRAYASYNFNMLDKDDVGDAAAEDWAHLGLRYDF